ncbi:uncharacterized protein [Apostichopus japonicus]|uniref:uncharacterized protein n=1 Tax=Stichopus japonicus TaxID=307972 RepID=UPI003AB32383
MLSSRTVQLRHLKHLPWSVKQSNTSMPPLWTGQLAFFASHVRNLSQIGTTANIQQTHNDESDVFPLTKEEAVMYLEKVLDIPNPLLQIEKQGKFNFLCEVQRRTKMVQPFTVLTYITPEYQGRSPSQQQVKDMMLNKQGGGCPQINTFTKAVLQRMGYEAYNIGGTLNKDRTPVYQSHVGLIVQNVTEKGSLHLVEPGSRLPIFDPVPLNFARMSQVYQIIGHGIRFFRECPGIVRLCIPIREETGDPNIDANVYNVDGVMWKTFITYDIIKESKWEYCYLIGDMLARNVCLIPEGHKDLFVCGFSRGLWTIIKGKIYIQYDSNGKDTIKTFRTNEEVIENTNWCFPQYSKDILRRYIEYTKRVADLLD